MRATMSRRFLLVLVCLAFPKPMWGQYAVGRVEGTVLDPTGAVLSGATVRLVNQDTNATRTFTTGRDGYYAFFALTPGRYTVTAEAATFIRRSVDLVVSSNQTVTQNLALEVKKASTTVEVRAAAPGQVNSADAQRS